MLELLLYRFLGFLVLALLTVHSAQWQEGRGLKVLGTNGPIHASEFRLCPKGVSVWFPWLSDQVCARLADSWLQPVALCRTFDHGCVVCPSLSTFVPIDLHADLFPGCLKQLDVL